jgi:hypothetical protein
MSTHCETERLDRLREFCVFSDASSCSVVPIATGAARQVVEFTQIDFLLTGLIMPRSRVRVPLSPPKSMTKTASDIHTVIHRRPVLDAGICGLRGY